MDHDEVDIASNLDRIGQKAAGKMVNQLADRFGREPQAAVSARIAGPMKPLQNSLSGFQAAIGADLGDRVGSLMTFCAICGKRTCRSKHLNNSLED